VDIETSWFDCFNLLTGYPHEATQSVRTFVQ